MKFCIDSISYPDRITAACEMGQESVGYDRSCKIPELRLLAGKAQRNDTSEGAKDI